MNASVVAVLNGSPCQSGEPSNTPDLQHSRYTPGESDDDSAHATPSDMTLAAQGSPQETWTTTKSMRSDFPIRAEEEVRKIHYIDTPAPATSLATTMPSAPAIEQDISITAPTAPTEPPQATDGSISFAALPSTSTIPPPATAVTAASQPTTSQAPTTTSDPAPPAASTADSTQTLAAPSGPPTSAVPGKPLSSTVEATPSHLATTASSSAASTPASTPGATPQTYARKRGRPRKHPLPDPNNPPPPKTKRKLSADAAAAKKKASTNAAARSAASNAASLLSVPDLGRLIPQGSSSENAQNFIQNNLRLFADLFVALQKQASTDHATRDEANAQLTGIAQVGAGSEVPTSQNPAVAAADEPMPASNEASASASTVTTDADAHQPSQSATAAAPATPLSKVSGPSDAIRDEIKKKMAEVSKGREAIQAEMLQMRVDASFFETAQKTVDERIVILRERIAKHTAVLEREREATRKVREATRKAKKDRKAREKSLRDSEREERRLAQTFMQLEKEIAAEEEERRRLEVEESDDEEGHQAHGGADHGTATADAFSAEAVTTSPSDGSSASGIATPPISNDTPASADRAIGFSDEELAKVLGISTSELAGFSQTLELTSLQPSSDPVNAQEAANASTNLEPSSSIASLLSAGLDSSEHPVVDAPDEASDNFDIAAFLEMASSFGQMPDESAPSQTHGNS